MKFLNMSETAGGFRRLFRYRITLNLGFLNFS
jgi:hypothetical protein